MTDSIDNHEPTSEFTEYLARDLARTLRHDARFAPSATAAHIGIRRVAGFTAGAVGVLMVGLVWGANTGFASADLVDARQREVIAGNVWATREFAAGRLELARVNYEQAQRALEKGGTTRASAQAAKAAMDEMSTIVARIDLDLRESRAPEARPRPFAILGRSPVKNAIAALTCANGPPASTVAQLRQGVPVIDLPAATVKTAATFGVVRGVREVTGGKLIVNDARRRQMTLFDSTLTVMSVPIDSAPGSATSYGPRPLPLIPYLGDSSLTVDDNAGTLLMLGPSGQITRAVASPYSLPVPPYTTLTTQMRLHAGVDDKGRILFEGSRGLQAGMSIADRLKALSTDTVAILRADLESRRVDTVGFAKSGGTTALMGRATEGGPVRFSKMPVEVIDAWSVLSDGSIAIVRGQDYHIDWIQPDGARHSTTKLPFDWKRLTDEDKQRLIDSVRAEEVPKLASAMSQSRPPTANPDAGSGGTGGGARVFVPRDENAPRTPMPMEYIPPALKDIPDYYPSIRLGAVMPDRDGNLWILPTSSAQSRNGELVYDLVNAKGEFHRVRLPVGTSIAGFGKGGVVFLQSGDRTNGFYLERTRLPAATKAPPR